MGLHSNAGAWAGVRVSDNVFASKDASSSVAQIRAGRLTSPQCIVVDNNRTADTSVIIPDAAWDVHAYDHPAITYTGEGWQAANDFPLEVHFTGAAQAAAELHFEGVQVWHFLSHLPLAFQ